jgi:hypothetical protein
MLAETDESIDSLEKLENGGKLIFPMGGSNVGLWVTRLHGLNRPEFHIFDRDSKPPDVPHYHEAAEAIKGRDNCNAVHTSKAWQ